MLRIYKRTLHQVLLVGLVFPALLVSMVQSLTQAQAAPLATIPSCGFTPSGGGPGTVVHAQLDQWYSSSPVEVGFAVPIVPNALQSGTLDPDPSTLMLLDRPMALMLPVNGHAETTFRVPAKLTSGKPMPLRNLYLVCIQGGQISMGGGAGPALFAFTASNLPDAGEPFRFPWLPLATFGTAIIIVGRCLRRQPQ